jgi:hypothetical protein
MNTGISVKNKAPDQALPIKSTFSKALSFEDYLELNSLPGQEPYNGFILIVKRPYSGRTEVEITPVHMTGCPFRAYVSGCEIYPVETIDKLDNLLTKIVLAKKQEK